MPDIDSAEKMVAKMRNVKRRKQIIELIDKILNGEIDSSEVPLDEIFKMYTSVRDQYELGGPRRQYLSPAERSTYNYGYMTIPEMPAGTENVWNQ